MLVIDDAELLPVAVLNFISQAISSARDALTVILISRGAMLIPVARARSLGLLVEVGAPELAFDDGEASELITRAAGVPVDTEIMQQIVRDAHGWAPGWSSWGNFTGANRHGARPGNRCRTISAGTSPDFFLRK